jgi:S-adenosylmethionine hydrolase
VHVAVVDPGVGSARAAVVVHSRSGNFFVGPDNGLLAPAVASDGGAEGIWTIENAAYIRSTVSSTFHGRDVFAPAAAHLALRVAAEQFGMRLASLKPLVLPEPVRAATGVRGEVIYVDRFGNLVTNISQVDIDAVATTRLSVSMPNVPAVPFLRAYAHAAPSGPLAIINSWGLLEIAVRDGNAARQLDAACGAVVTVTPTS